MSVQESKRVCRDRSSVDDAGKDYLSSLPDDLLIRILDFVGSNEAPKTHSLSSRWRFLWSYCTNMRFVVDGLDGVSPDFVDQVMDHYKGANLQSLAISVFMDSDRDCKYKSIIHEFFDSWIQFAVGRGVANLDLACDSYSSSWKTAVPDEVYLASSVRRLCLSSCVFYPDEVRMSSLKELRLSRVMLDQCSVKLLCSGCPVLELIVLENCIVDYQMPIRVTNPSVQRIVIIDCPYVYGWSSRHFGDKYLEIFAPFLKFLELRGILRNEYAIAVPSLVSAKLDFFFSNEGNVCTLKGLLSSLNCSNLQLCGWCVQVLSLSQMKQLHIDPCNSVKHLHLRLPLLKCELLGLSRMVEVFPFLESLEISFGFWDGGEREPPSDGMRLSRFSISDFRSTEWDEVFDDNQSMSKLESESWESINISFFSHLRNLKVTDFNGFFGFGNMLGARPSQMCKLHWKLFRRQVQLAQKLVTSSPVLERTVIELPVCKNLDPSVELALRQLVFTHVDEKFPVSSDSLTILWGPKRND